MRSALFFFSKTRLTTRLTQKLPIFKCFNVSVKKITYFNVNVVIQEHLNASITN